MSPEARATAAALARLVAEIDEDRRGLDKRFADARESERRLAGDSEDPASLALAAVGLHGWYTGLEAIFERVARELDATVPTGDRWHRDLLVQMSAEVPGLRPAIIDASLVGELTLLLAFRHFFRDAYAVTFESARLQRELTRLRAIEPRVRAALDKLEIFLRQAMASTASLD